MKICRKCGVNKPSDGFHTDRAKSDQRATVCKMCVSTRKREQYAANPEKFRAANAINRIGKSKQKQSRNYQRTYQNKYRTEKFHELRAKRRMYLKDNASSFARYAANRRASKLQATPKWANATEIQAFYTLSVLLTREAGHPYEVDHIVPLRSDIVCGLHWEGNLQVLPKIQNLEKGNRYWPDMPE